MSLRIPVVYPDHGFPVQATGGRPQEYLALVPIRVHFAHAGCGNIPQQPHHVESIPEFFRDWHLTKQIQKHLERPRVGIAKPLELRHLYYRPTARRSASSGGRPACTIFPCAFSRS
jgi:hypothetical protein